MNIAQALKEKNRVAANIQKLLRRAILNNVAEKDSPKDYSSKVALTEAQQEMDKLVTLKTAIHEASASVRKKIFRLSELKGMLGGIEHFPTTGQINKNRTSGDVMSHTVAEITTEAHDKFLDETQKEIDKIQEELDAFNHTTNIKY